MNIAHYSLLLINPTIDRLDTVVCGAVFKGPQGWDVRVADSVQKMRAIDPSFPTSKLIQTHELASEVARGVSDFPALQTSFERSRWGILIDKFVGSFTFDDVSDYHRQVKAVLTESVNPPSIAQANVAPVSRRRNVVRRKLRDHFKAGGIWSRKHNDIDNHRVVEQFPVSLEHGVIADFALRNGVMHITETIDFEMQSLKGKKLEAQAKTLVLSEAVRIFGYSTKTYVVAAGSSRSDVKQSVSLLGDHATVFALESSADMKSYVDAITSAAMYQRLLP